jgi:hypothetical protein
MGLKGHARAFARVPKVYFLSFVLPPLFLHLWSAWGGGGGDCAIFLKQILYY